MGRVSFPKVLPESTAAPLRGGPTLRWGVLGPGAIAAAFTQAMHENTDQRVVAVGSRSAERSAQFAAAHGVERSYGDYDSLVVDPGVDIVYIATTNNTHRDAALLAISAGKHILVEKPIALDADEAREIAAAARAAGVFAMEAMWSRFLPKATVIHRLLDDGAIGDIQLVTASLGWRFEYDPASRIYDPAVGGGALLDLGVYSLWWNHFALGTPDAVEATGVLAPTGVDDQAVVTLAYPGAQGVAIASTRANLDNRGTINGSRGAIHVPEFLAPGGFHVHGPDGAELEYTDPSGLRWRDGLCFQAAAVARHVAEGRTEAPEHPLERSIAIMDALVAAQTAIGYGRV